MSSYKTNFGNIPKENSGKDSPIVIVPVPYDETSTWQKGADKRPEAILDASANMELYDIETNSEVYLQGIFTDKPVLEKSSPEKMAAAVKERIARHLNENKFTVILGGEHSVSIGAIQAYAERYNDLTILQLDAHGDTREEYEDSKCNHACVMARAREVAPIVQVGIRSMEASEMKKLDKKRIFFAHDLYNNKDWMKKAVHLLSRNVYITIDLDIFDPAFLPATGTPEPGGLSWYEVINFLKMVIKEKNLVGFDVVELCPNKESKASDFTAAKLIYTLLSQKFKGDTK